MIKFLLYFIKLFQSILFDLQQFKPFDSTEKISSPNRLEMLPNNIYRKIFSHFLFMLYIKIMIKGTKNYINNVNVCMYQIRIKFSCL